MARTLETSLNGGTSSSSVESLSEDILMLEREIREVSHMRQTIGFLWKFFFCSHRSAVWELWRQQGAKVLVNKARLQFWKFNCVVKKPVS